MFRVARFRSLGLLFVIASNTLAAGEAAFGSAATAAKPVLKAAAKAKPLAMLAPADRYFGPTKMSIVGMHTAIVDLGERYHAREIADADLVHAASIVETALYKWHDEYPKDPGAAATAFELEQLYQVVQSTDARGHATSVLNFIAKAAPQSPQAHLSRLRLAQGFPALTAETATHATPNPYRQEADRTGASPAAAADAAASTSAVSGSPDPTATAVAAASPVPASAAAPAADPAASVAPASGAASTAAPAEGH